MAGSEAEQDEVEEEVDDVLERREWCMACDPAEENEDAREGRAQGAVSGLGPLRGKVSAGRGADKTAVGVSLLPLAWHPERRVHSRPAAVSTGAL